MAANNIGPGILILPPTTLLRMDRHNMVIHIIHTATHGKDVWSRFKLGGERGSQHQVGTDADRAAGLAIDESTMGQGVMMPPSDAAAAVAATDIFSNTEVKEARYLTGSSGRELEAIQGTVREKWGKLTDDMIWTSLLKAGSTPRQIQERYGITKEEAEKEFKKHWV